METYFEVVVTKLDTHLTLIRELASTTATSNALNVELITRTSSNATFNFEDSLSAVPDKICPSASENPYDEAIQRSSETAVQVSTSQGGNENDMQRNSSPIPVELQSGNPKSSASRIQSTNAKIVGSRSCSHGSATATFLQVMQTLLVHLVPIRLLSMLLQVLTQLVTTPHGHLVLLVCFAILIQWLRRFLGLSSHILALPILQIVPIREAMSSVRKTTFVEVTWKQLLNRS